MSASFPEHLAGLLRTGAYPHPVHEVRLVETHVSWVLLTGEFAYKIKRPVCYPFVDLRSRERRTWFCLEELRLNRRFAPQLYVDVCAITMVAGEARIGGSGELIEHAVKMRQFSREEELDTLLAHGRIEPAELAAFGRQLAAIHSGLPVAEPGSAWGDPASVRAALSRNLEECAQVAAVFATAPAVQGLRPMLERYLDAAAPWLTGRRLNGRVRECHGDLHSGNIVRQGSHLTAFDCMEFEPAFRWIDVAEEIAFLLADLEARQCPRHAQAFLDGYLAQSGDYQACRVLDLYKAHRALVRAKVAALGEPRPIPGGMPAATAPEGARLLHLAYLECARRALSHKQPVLVLMSGLSGSGKTWLATRLAPMLGSVHVRSDVERKRLAGLSEHARSGASIGQGLYSRGFSTQVYEHLASAAEHVLCGDYSVIVDATFARRDDRRRFGELSRQLGVALILIHCRAPPDVLRSRVGQRYEQGTDASEADVAVLRWQQEHWDPIGADEHLAVIEVETATVDIGALAHRIVSAVVVNRSG